MHVEGYKIGIGCIADAHRGESNDKEERQNAEWTVPNQFHPEVAHLYLRTLALVHDQAFLTLKESD